MRPRRTGGPTEKGRGEVRAFLCFASLWLVFPALASRSDLFLYEQAKNNTVLATKDLLPKRLYLKFIEPLDRWAFVLTDEMGKLPDPIEVVGIHSSVSGKKIGAENPDQNFELMPNGDFQSSMMIEHMQFLVLAKEPYMKTVSVRPGYFHEVKTAGELP